MSGPVFATIGPIGLRQQRPFRRSQNQVRMAETGVESRYETSGGNRGIGRVAGIARVRAARRFAWWWFLRSPWGLFRISWRLQCAPRWIFRSSWWLFGPSCSAVSRRLHGIQRIRSRSSERAALRWQPCSILRASARRTTDTGRAPAGWTQAERAQAALFRFSARPHAVPFT